MEVIFSLFRIISSFLTDTLYEQSIINNLFSFDLDKKIITIKQKKKKKKICSSDDIKIYSPDKPLNEYSPKNTIFLNDEQNIQTKNRLNSEALTQKLGNNNLATEVVKVKKKKKRKIKKKEPISTNIFMNLESNELKSKNVLEDNLNKNGINNCHNKINNINENKMIINEDKIINYEINKQIENKENENRNIVNKIKLNRLCICCCFLCVRKQKNIHNFLLDEGMKIVSEKLDILYLFRVLSRDESLQEKLMEKEQIIEMSDECKDNLQFLYNSKNKNKNKNII